MEEERDAEGRRGTQRKKQFLFLRVTLRLPSAFLSVPLSEEQLSTNEME